MKQEFIAWDFVIIIHAFCVSCSQDEDDYYESATLTPEPSFSNAEQTRMIHLRRYLEYLAEMVDEKNYVTDKTREELKKCREQIQLLEKQRDETFLEIQKVDSEGNT